jgi:hypothetical protein
MSTDFTFHRSGTGPAGRRAGQVPSLPTRLIHPFCQPAIADGGRKEIKPMRILVISFLFFLLSLSSYAQEAVYHPAIPGDQSKDTVKIVNVRLISSQETFDRNIQVKYLGGFLQEIQKNIEKSVGSPNQAFELMLQITLSKDSQPAFEISTQGEPPETVLKSIYNGLSSIEDRRSKEEDLVLQMHFAINK